MKVTITILDNPNGTATVDVKFSEPTPKRADYTAATKIGLELLNHIKQRSTKGHEEFHMADGSITTKPIFRPSAN